MNSGREDTGSPDFGQDLLFASTLSQTLLLSIQTSPELCTQASAVSTELTCEADKSLTVRTLRRVRTVNLKVNSPRGLTQTVFGTFPVVCAPFITVYILKRPQ